MITNDINLPNRSAGNNRHIISPVERNIKRCSTSCTPSCWWVVADQTGELLLHPAPRPRVPASRSPSEAAQTAEHTRVRPTRPDTHNGARRGVSAGRDRLVWARLKASRSQSCVWRRMGSGWGEGGSVGPSSTSSRGGSGGAPRGSRDLVTEYLWHSCTSAAGRWWRKGLALQHLIPVQ